MESGIFDQPDAHRTLALEVEGRKFWVCRGTLVSFSPVFKAMLYGPFEEEKQEVIPLPGKKSEDVEQLLLFLHPCLAGIGKKTKVITENLDSILALADEYQIDPIKSFAEQFLINKLAIIPRKCDDHDDQLLSMLSIGSKFRMKDLLFRCVKRCAAELTTEKLIPIITELSSEVVAAYFLLHEQLKAAGKEKCSFWPGEHFSCHTCDRITNLTCYSCKLSFCVDCINNAMAPEYCGSLLEKMQSLENDVRELLDRM